MNPRFDAEGIFSFDEEEDLGGDNPQSNVFPAPDDKDNEIAEPISPLHQVSLPMVIPPPTRKNLPHGATAISTDFTNKGSQSSTRRFLQLGKQRKESENKPASLSSSSQSSKVKITPPHTEKTASRSREMERPKKYIEPGISGETHWGSRFTILPRPSEIATTDYSALYSSEVIRKEKGNSGKK